MQNEDAATPVDVVVWASVLYGLQRHGLRDPCCLLIRDRDLKQSFVRADCSSSVNRVFFSTRVAVKCPFHSARRDCQGGPPDDAASVIMDGRRLSRGIPGRAGLSPMRDLVFRLVKLGEEQPRSIIDGIIWPDKRIDGRCPSLRNEDQFKTQCARNVDQSDSPWRAAPGFNVVVTEPRDASLFSNMLLRVAELLACRLQFLGDKLKVFRFTRHCNALSDQMS